MCGIWGLLSLDTDLSKTVDNDKLFKLINSIKNRGPDRTIYIDNNNYKIGFHRLSIMDTSIQGDQPFSYSEYITDDNNKILRTVYVVCNGEIYNYNELKKLDFLEKTNYKLKSLSDCEILLPLFLHYGIDKMITLLNGEFAFAIYDVYENLTQNTKNYNLYLGRDRFGIRPLFFTFLNDKTIVFCSEMKGLIFDNNIVNIFNPRTWMHISGNDKLEFFSKEYYTIGKYPIITKPDLDEVKRIIRDTLIEAVRIRLHSDRELGCLLSGGLDSSLVASIASKLLSGRKLRTFCVSIEGQSESPDAKYAKLVAEHIGSIHTDIIIPEKEWLDKLEKIIEISETYDITTIRATTGQYLVSKWISENTDIKVLLIGDGSDELTSGYVYFHKAPNPYESHLENIRLLTNIHKFDVLRADRGIASNGLEARVPFLDYNFVDLYLSIDPSLRVPQNYNGYKCEKWLLRKAFEDTNLLPLECLYRNKEAFSDAVSTDRSWYKIIQENINNTMSDEYFETNRYKYSDVQPHTKEALYYRILFEIMYENQGHVLSYYWLPKWVGNVIDPSARTLNIINTKEVSTVNK